MYPELEKYYENLCKTKIPDGEIENILYMTHKLSQIGLLSADEHGQIINMISRSIEEIVDGLLLSVRTKKALRMKSIYSYQQLRKLLINEGGDDALFGIRSLGEVGIAEIIHQAVIHGIVTLEEVLGAEWKGTKRKAIEEICNSPIE